MEHARATGLDFGKPQCPLCATAKPLKSWVNCTPYVIRSHILNKSAGCEIHDKFYQHIQFSLYV